MKHRCKRPLNTPKTPPLLATNNQRKKLQNEETLEDNRNIY